MTAKAFQLLPEGEQNGAILQSMVFPQPSSRILGAKDTQYLKQVILMQSSAVSD